MIVLVGPTGSGKTEVLRALAARGSHVLDLEALASHLGSAFGATGSKSAQPPAHVFERAIVRICGERPSDRLWVEHEGPYLGSLAIPRALIAAMHHASAVALLTPRRDRIARIVTVLRSRSIPSLLASLDTLRPRLLTKRYAYIRSAFERGALASAVEALLPYYDRRYAHQCGRRAGAVVAEISTRALAADTVKIISESKYIDQ